MASADIPMEELLRYLEVLANESLSLWDVPEGASARLINVSENATYLVEAPGWKSILRVHREDYHTERAIQCELAWSTALREDGAILTPGYYLGRDGKAIQSGIADGLSRRRFMVMFEFVEGTQPDETHDLVKAFEDLGEIAARTHLHSIGWTRPEPFERLTWGLEAVFGPQPTWGNWRDAPKVTPEIRDIL
ncbi:MAG: aminoglycoside phosphotransferase, partial [Proteobacteria bacterium]